MKPTLGSRGGMAAEAQLFPEAKDSILTLAEAAEIVPLSEKTLRREALKDGGPFLKIANRWMVYEGELHNWVRSHKPRQRATGAELDPMPSPRRRGSSFRSNVIDLERRAS